MQPALRIPGHALPFLGPLIFPYWETGGFATENFEHLAYGGVLVFTLPDGNKVLVFTADADVDTDGPNGSTAVDPWWQGETALRYPDGSSCDSRTFPGIVTPPGLRKEFGMRLGDFSFVLWRGVLVPCQVYDTGPTRKIGEISLFTARESGVAPASQSDHQAATIGNSAMDVVYVIFVNSGPGHAIASADIVSSVTELRGSLLAAA